MQCIDTGRKPSLWYHNNFSFSKTGFVELLNYQHADLRKEINSDHISDRDYQRLAQSDECLQYGYKDLWLFDSVTNRDDLMWETFHTIKIVAKVLCFF